MSGRLSIYIVSDPIEWHGGVREGDRYLNIDFVGPEWEALFFDVLHCPGPEPYIEGEDLNEYDARFQAKFQQAIPEFPMLGRIWDTYRDTGYTPEQVKRLQSECVKIVGSTNNALALEGLHKLILACDEAFKSAKGLFLVSD